MKQVLRHGLTMTNGTCFAYTKDIFDKTKGFNISLLTNEDHDLARRASKHGKFVFLDIKIYTSGRRFYKSGFLKAFKEQIKSMLMYIMKRKSNPDYWK